MFTYRAEKTLTDVTELLRYTDYLPASKCVRTGTGAAQMGQVNSNHASVTRN
jgi:hypothetical protein